MALQLSAYGPTGSEGSLYLVVRRHLLRSGNGNALSEFSYVFWDFEDLLKRLADELNSQKNDKMELYEHLLQLLRYLEEELLNENYRFSSFSRKQNRAKLHLENCYYLLRVEIEKHIKNMGQEIRNGTDKFEKVLTAKNKLIECIGEIGKYL
jgi:hypothetical protein